MLPADRNPVEGEPDVDPLAGDEGGVEGEVELEDYLLQPNSVNTALWNEETSLVVG